MKVLFVVSDDYPFSGACTSLLKNMFFDGKLADKIDRLDVLSVKYRLEDLDETSDKGINIYRVLSWRFIYADEIRKELKKHPFLVASGAFQKALLVCNRRLFPHNYFNSLTLRDFLRGLNKVNALQYQAIVAVGGDFHAVEAVRRYVNKNYGPRFIFYQVDPCYSKMTELDVTLDSRKNFECQVYSTVDAVLTTPIIYEEARHNHCEPYIHKFSTIEFPNVTKWYATHLQKNDDERNITCLFAGSIYSGIRDPRYTLELFRKVVDEQLQLRFIFIGINQEQLPNEYKCNWIQCMGVRSLDETRRMIAKADILVNIGNAMLNQVPSKLFEYISTGLPIVNICKNKNCPTQKYLEKYPYALNVFENLQELDNNVEKVKYFIHMYAHKRLSLDRIMESYVTCTPEYCANQMFDAINGDSVVETR